jgi:hypothetical protein
MADDFISGALAGQQFQLNKFLIQEAPVKLEQQKLNLKIAEQDYSRHEQMAKLLADSSGKVPPGQNPMENAIKSLTDVGEAAAKSGLPEEAISAISKAATMQNQMETAAWHKATETLAQTKFADSMLAQAHDQKSWDTMNAFIELQTGKPSAMKDKPYSDELRDALLKSSESKRTAAQTALDEAHARKAETDTRLDEVRIGLVKAQTQLAATRAANAKKVGGDGLIAKPRDVADVTNEIRALLDPDNTGNITPTTARSFANDIALRAAELRDKNRMTQEQAVNKAVQEANNHGVFAGIRPAPAGLGTIKRPMPVPKDMGDPKAWKDNMVYKPDKDIKNSKGEVVWPAGELRHVMEGKAYPMGEGPENDEAAEDDE